LGIWPRTTSGSGLEKQGGEMNCANALPEWNDIVKIAEAKVKEERIQEIAGEIDERIIELSTLTGKSASKLMELIEKAHQPKIIITVNGETKNEN